MDRTVRPLNSIGNRSGSQKLDRAFGREQGKRTSLLVHRKDVLGPYTLARKETNASILNIFVSDTRFTVLLKLNPHSQS